MRRLTQTASFPAAQQQFGSIVYPMRDVEFSKEPIELYKILKFENMVNSGGEAKYVIAEGQVRVNGEIETRKRKKIFSGDIIEFQNETLHIRVK